MKAKQTVSPPNDRPDIVNLVDIYLGSGNTGPLWGCETAELNGTYLVLQEGESNPAHVNNAVDVIMVVLSGEGELILDGVRHSLVAGHVAVLRKGSERSLRTTAGPFSYLNIHKRRVLMPGDKPSRR